MLAQELADDAARARRAVIDLKQPGAGAAVVEVDRKCLLGHELRRIDAGAQQQPAVLVGNRVKGDARQGVADLARLLQEMGQRMGSPDAPGHLARMNRGACRLLRLKLGPRGIAEPGRDRVFVGGELKQPAQRLAVLRQAKNTAIDAVVAFPGEEMPRLRLEPFDAIGIGIGPDRAVAFGQKVIAEKVGMQRRAAGAAVAQEIVLRQDVTGIGKVDASGRVADRLIGIKRHRMARIDEGFQAQLFQKTEVTPDPKRRDPVVTTHTCPLPPVPGVFCRDCGRESHACQ